jgi:hypothetical protein
MKPGDPTAPQDPRGHRAPPDDEPRRMLTDRAAIVSAFASILASIVIAIAAGRLGRTQVGDHREYVVTASRLITHGTIVSPLIKDDTTTVPSNLQPPVYIGLLALAYRILGIESFTATLFVQFLQMIAVALAVRWIALTAGHLGGPAAAWIAGAIAAFHPALLRYTTTLWDTSMMTCAVALVVYIVATWRPRHPSIARWFGFGLLLGGVARSSFLTLLGWLLAITPWTVRNYVHFHQLNYIRNSLPLEFWLGFCPAADMSPIAAFEECFPLKSAAEQRLVVELGEPAYLAECARRARHAVTSDPARAAKLVGIRILDYWTAHAFSLRPWSSGRSLPHVLGVWLLAGESLLVFVGLVVFWKRAEFRWMAVIALLFSAVYCLTHFMVRYRAPSEPILIVITALAIVGFHRRLSAPMAKTSAHAPSSSAGSYS